MTNLYWPVYKNLEKEVIEISNHIHIDDKQLSVYSVKILELLIRCVVEIESISKDLFFRIGGTKPTDGDLYFDTHCLKLLEDEWNLSKKKIIVSATNFYLQEEKNKVIIPLYKAHEWGKKGSEWKRAYQSVKHNRVSNLMKGNIKNLIQGLAALFILNIYYKDEVYDFEKDSNATNFPISMGSELFAIKLHKLSSYDEQFNYLKKEEFDECIYLTKWTNESLEKMKEATSEMKVKQIELFQKHQKFHKYLETNRIEDYKSDDLMWDVLGEDDYFKIIQDASQNRLKVLAKTKHEATLNKNNV